MVDGVAAPQQERSRESFARVRQATTELLCTKGVAGVTIAEVAAIAGVSVGTIYGRVGSRANLLKVVHAEESIRVVDSLESALAEVEVGDDQLESVRSMIAVFLRQMSENAQILKALIALGQTDEEIRVRGVESWTGTRTAATDALRRAITTDVPPATIGWIFEIVYAVVVRHLDIGNAHPKAPPKNEPTDALVDNLARTVLLLLPLEPSGNYIV